MVALRTSTCGGVVVTGDPIVDVVVQLFEDLVAEGARALDPEARQKRAREAVEEQLGRLHTADPGSLRTRLDVIEAAVRARLAEQAASVSRVSVADLRIVAPLLVSPMLSAEERASVRRVHDHAAIALGEPTS